MKTLLLALLVVTVVCLDFGHTLICYTCPGVLCKTKQKCPKGQNLCFRRRKFYDLIGFGASRGCAATCPTVGRSDVIACCSTNRCNF
ncbi:weak neurotoxin 10-like [Thamnophis elegans]|uniref:weak neurotoxin 10-like n=1 Tax=Thamnophis elegans TaxID=35005 RepID=UPI00137855BD|nr:weak neurotoxin 10-like [Thamnophis elegans]